MQPNLDPSLVAVFLELVVAAILGIIIGLERTAAHKNAGMRTYALVSLGSCLFVSASIIVTHSYIGIVNFDPLRVAANVLTGVGFIGGGLIVFSEHKLHGLTSAAGLWVAAGVGVATGLGLYVIAIFSTLLTMVVFTLVWFIEEKMKNYSFYSIDSTIESVVKKDVLINE